MGRKVLVHFGLAEYVTLGMKVNFDCLDKEMPTWGPSEAHM
jgi:hypothetical protein